MEPQCFWGSVFISNTMSSELLQELFRNSINGLVGEAVFCFWMFFFFFTQASSKDILAHIEILLDLGQFQHMVPDTTVTHLSSNSLISYVIMNVPVSEIVGLATPPVHIVQLVSSGSGFARMDKQVCA